ncbi:uncharacterized protein LOC116014537 [Ipomoea triloba]|uniref:uncharacterized protein LOC116014537 n=1 Tax=Ipomoea triloba TaxID=35885 RepID=UPI00125D2253|nr:uncharacterized protein LOC116014537 [Ipomoea triloba]
MVRAMKALLNWPRWHHHVCSRAVMIRFLHSPMPFSPASFCRRPPFSSTPLASRHLSSRPGAIRLRDAPVPPEPSESGSESDTPLKKSRNEKKREAQRGVRWGMELAKFQPPQIKRILRVAALEREVYEAIMLVKRLGRDVREGKRRQFNYIGRLLRDVDPELMDGLIEATKDGDQNKFQALSGSITWSTEDENDDEVDETEDEDEDEDEDDDNEESIELAERWFDGLINKDVEVSNEIYSLREVEFDRQELRSLVRKVQSIQRPEVSEEGKESEVDITFINAKKSLTRFLVRIAKQLPVE